MIASRALLCSGLLLAAAASGRGQGSAPVLLPPFVVSGRNVHWLDARRDGIEILSRCPESTTQEFFGKMHRARQVLGALLPAEACARPSLPAAFILYGDDMLSTLPAEVLDQMKRATAREDVRTPPNFMLVDQDEVMTVVLYRPGNGVLLLDADCVRFLMAMRAPSLPPWAVAGFVALYRTARFASNGPLFLVQDHFSEERFEFAPQEWLTPEETRGIRSDKKYPRRMLSLGLLFDPSAEAAAFGPDPVGTFTAEAQLFVRWCYEPGHAERRAALWKLAEASAADPLAGEDLFQKCFGFGYGELQRRLLDYLPDALSRPVAADLGSMRDPPNADIQAATPAEIGRIKGEWERLEVRYVRARLPAMAEAYLSEARQTLADAARAAPQGEPALFAVMGLCENDFGDAVRARGDLEVAVQGGAVHPRAYCELARLRFLQASADPAGRDGGLSGAQASLVSAPLLAGIRQEPPLSAAYRLLAEVWARCSARLPREDENALLDGARLFPGEPDVLYLTAAALRLHGLAEADAVIDRGLREAPDESVKARFAALKAAGTKRPSPARP